MQKKSFEKMFFTNDLIIRSALVKCLAKKHARNRKLRIIEELGVNHGAARIDVAVVNGVMHGYEIKSDLDTLQRLSEQMKIYSGVFDEMTIVVGRNHLHETIERVPEWWGVWMAKVDANNSIVFHVIRKGETNKELNPVSVARLLWREEAIKLLEEAGEAKGFYSKSRSCLYERLSVVFDKKTLSKKVREKIFFREDWRPDAPLLTCDG